MTNVVWVVQVQQDDQSTTRTFVEKLTAKAWDGPCTWRISTKYYETDVNIRRGTVTEGLEAEAFEALVLIVQLRHEGDLLRAKTWFEHQLEKIGERWPISLLILDSEERLLPSWFDEEISWCIENGFEWIHVALNNAEIDEQLALEDGHGMARVEEALKAHLWPGCISKKSSSNAETQPSTQLDDDPSAENEEEDVFEKLLTEMTNARDRLRLLSDQERREGAADLAMKLAQFFQDE